MTVFGIKGAVDNDAAVVGEWPDVNLLSTDGNRINLGNVTDGTAELSREDFTHFGTAVPRLADYVVPIQMGLRFTGNVSEFHRVMFHAMVGDELSNSSRYIYTGVQGCGVYFTFQALRKYACADTVIEYRIFKCRPGGLLSFGSNATENVVMPFSVEGLDDQADVMGQGGSATAPLGYLHVAIEGANVVTNVSVP